MSSLKKKNHKTSAVFFFIETMQLFTCYIYTYVSVSLFFASWNLKDHNFFYIKIPSIGERTVFGSLPRTSDSNLITRPLISWSSLVKCSLVNTDFRINIWCLSTCMLIIKLSCTVNSKYIFDSKYEMGFKLLNVFSSSEARGGKACVTKQGLMVTCILYVHFTQFIFSFTKIKLHC